MSQIFQFSFPVEKFFDFCGEYQQELPPQKIAEILEDMQID